LPAYDGPAHHAPEAHVAIPPEPIQELLPRANLIVEAEVSAVLSTGPRPPQVKAREGATSVPNKVASQVVKLKVKRALKGQASGELTVDKPEADYALAEGNKGAFFLEQVKGAANMTIIGRWGPDTYRVDSVERALKELGG
jgi:hypothetical protein